VRGLREPLQVLHSRAAAVGVARAQRRGDERLEQPGLAVGGGAERPQMPRRDPVARERVARSRDLDVRLGIEPASRLEMRLEQAVLLELADAGRVQARATAQLLELDVLFLGAERGAAAAALAAGARRELLADHA